MIGLMGGTFNPIHYGHLRPALEIAEILDLDEVRFIPAKQPPLRDEPCVSAEHRSKMVELAIQDEARFVLDERELHRDNVSYTVDTLQSLRKELGDELPMCWLMGMDAYQRFTRWHQWGKILQLTHLVVSHRPSYVLENSKLDSYCTKKLSDLSSVKAGKVFFVSVTQLDISATMVRESLKNNRSIRYLLPDTVHNYINENNLYS